MFIVMFGLNDIPKVIIGFLYAVAAMVINTLNGLDRVAPVLLKTAKVLRMSRAAITFHSTTPKKLPGVKISNTTLRHLQGAAIATVDQDCGDLAKMGNKAEGVPLCRPD